jgi:hypothetical protein
MDRTNNNQLLLMTGAVPAYQLADLVIYPQNNSFRSNIQIPINFASVRLVVIRVYFSIFNLTHPISKFSL